jgi:predicted small lipoprotein YifL
MPRIAVLLIVLNLAACGTKGPLELPPGPAPKPVFSSGSSVLADVTTPSNQSDQ